ncbi:MAG: chemotaxis protein CheW [Burkholderiaceae bacterium]
MSADSAAIRFDVEISGMRLLLPAGMPCEYFAQAIVYPLPRAPRRLLGMMHLRGHPVPVFDTHSQATDLLPIVQRCQLVVLRSSHEAVGLICDSPPGTVNLLGEVAEGESDNLAFGPALGTAYRVTSDEPGESNDELRRVRAFDLARLIDCCLSDPLEVTS